MKFEVKNRWSGEVQFTAEIECDENAPTGVKLGLALRWGISTDADLRDADLRDADLRGADLRDADLSDADLRGADLRGADLRGAYLRGANLSDADLRGADLRGANLRGANLSDADLSDADLSDADLRGANLRDADLRGANLRDAYLRGANLRGANLSDADLRGAELKYGVTVQRVIAIAKRPESPYTFMLWATECGHVVTAGCRQMTIAEYRERVSEVYPDCTKGQETTRILNYFQVCLEAHEAAS